MRVAGSLSLVVWAFAAALATPGATQTQGPSHGLSTFGPVKYGPDFKHFAYVNPGAPKGGDIRLHSIGGFDNLNPFILKGEPEDNAALPFDTLMEAAGDEPDSAYGLIAKSVEVAPDRTYALFTLHPEARFHDGSPITAEDVVWTFETIRTKGHPRYRIVYRDIAKVEAIGRDKVKFTFNPGETRDLPLIAAGLPVLSKAFFAENEFDRTTLKPVLGSGPYQVEKVEAGRSITYKRVADYWAKDLPVNVGRHNFERIRVDYYRDRAVAFEAFKSYEYDFREEFTSKTWATEYDFPGTRKKQVLRATLPDARPSGTQAYFLNTRRDKLNDVRVREAIALAFDFEWLNKNLFHGLYRRTKSVYENSDLAARGVPSESERLLLEPFRDKLPADLFAKPIHFPATDGSGNARDNLRRAADLLKATGWAIKDGKLRNAKNEPFEIEFLTFEPSFERVIAPLVKNLERLGIAARIRIVDSAQYRKRVDEFDFDITTARFVMSLTPGIEQRNMWGSDAADVSGSYNLAGIKHPVIDALIETMVAAKDRDALTAAARAADRVILWNHYLIPQWFKGEHNIAYWDKFGFPAEKPKYAPGYPDTWWHDAAKAAALAQARSAGD